MRLAAAILLSASLAGCSVVRPASVEEVFDAASGDPVVLDYGWAQ